METGTEIDLLTFQLHRYSTADLEEILTSARRVYALGIEAAGLGNAFMVLVALQSMNEHVDHLISLHRGSA